jgi:hypothetical protein
VEALTVCNALDGMSEAQLITVLASARPPKPPAEEGRGGGNDD